MEKVDQLAQQFILLRCGRGHIDACIDWAMNRSRLDEGGKHADDIALLAAATSYDETLLHVESIIEAHFGVTHLRDIPVEDDALSKKLGVPPLECHFYFEVIATTGLLGIEKSLSVADLGLSIYHSHFNNKNILKSINPNIELGMDTSTTDVMHGSGFLYYDFEMAVSLMQKLSHVLCSAGYSHRIGIDDANGNNTVWIKHNYS